MSEFKNQDKTSSRLTKTLAKVGLFVNEDLGRDNIAERHKHLQQILITKLLWQMVDEQVCSFRAFRKTEEKETDNFWLPSNIFIFNLGLSFILLA